MRARRHTNIRVCARVTCVQGDPVEIHERDAASGIRAALSATRHVCTARTTYRVEQGSG